MIPILGPRRLTQSIAQEFRIDAVWFDGEGPHTQVSVDICGSDQANHHLARRHEHQK
jgi:hypothetical protein